MLTTAATAQDLCRRAAKFVGILAEGQDFEPEMSEDILTIANGMLDAWNMDRLFVYNVNFAVYALTANNQSQSIGPTAASPFNVTRPHKIENANIVITSQTPNVRRGLYLLDDDEWMSFSVRPLPTPTIPTSLYYSRDFPNATLYFWPTPTSGLSVELETWVPLTQFTNLSTAFSFPPGYFEAIYQNLGLRLCTPEWGLSEVPAVVQQLAQESRMRIESLNMDPPPKMKSDGGMMGTRQGTQSGPPFNIKNPAPNWYR